MSELYERISEREIPMDNEKRVLLDLYILMPASKRYIKFVPKGEIYSDEKKDKLKKHILPNIFILPSEFSQAQNEKNNINKIEVPEGFAVEVLGKRATKNLRVIYTDLLDEGEKDPEAILSNLQHSADQILSLVAPESKEITSIFMNNAKYINLMNDACAITSLAVMFAFANGFDSKKSYLELTQAALVMDVALSNLSEEDKEKMYCDFDALSIEIKDLILNHPKSSYDLVTKKLKGLSEITMQLVLNHHELFNGKGFPRGVRTESLFPLVKVLALAVDVHHKLKTAGYKGEEADLVGTILEIHNDKAEAHLRRHNRALTQKILNFFNSAEAAA